MSQAPRAAYCPRADYRLKARPARMAAARAMARSLSAATRAEATGLSAKVAKPQSGVRSTRSAPKTSTARRACATISAGVSTRSSFWLTTPTPFRQVAGRSFRTSISPARGVQSSPGEAELREGVALLAQGAAHEAPAVLLAGEDDLGEHGLVELHEARAGREQEVDLLAQHAHDVRGQILARAIRALGDALHPHRAREEIRAGQGDLHRPVGERAREGELVNRQGPAPAEAPEHDGMAHVGGGHVERSQLRLEHLGIVDQRQQAGERDELAVVEAAAHEARAAARRR